MSQGSVGTPAEKIQVHFFAPPDVRESGDQKEIRRKTQQKCNTEGVDFHVRRAELVKVTSGQTSGRAFHLVKIEDARNLYEQIHRAPVVVMSSVGCFIRRDPSSQPVRRKQLISLEGFVRYKAHFRMFRSPFECSRFTERIGAMKIEYPVSGVHDPRILPLHIFDAHREWEHLEEDRELQDFHALFGASSTRRDRGRREWAKAKAMHGGSVLRVHDVEIPRGYHWDVTRQNGEERITTTHEVWKLPGKTSYCNVYPDGYVRQGQGKGKNQSRRVWP